MMRLVIIMFAMVGLSCDSEMVRPNPVDDDKKAQVQVEETTGQSELEPLEYTREEVWVCYNPGTEMHNQECIEETYPEGCYVKGDSSVFCWLLMKPDCERSDKEYQDVCHLLRQ